MQKNKNKNQGGFIIPFVIVFGTVFAMILASLLGYVGLRYDQSVRQAAKNNALQASEAGLNYYHWYILHALEGKTSAQIDAYWTGSPLGVPYYDGQIYNQSGSPIAKYRLEVTPPVSGSTIIQLKITGWDLKHPTIKRVLAARLRKPSWSEFSVIANDVMRFGEGTEIWGPIHSNNGIRFDGVAHNLISSAVSSYYDPDTNSTKPGVWTSKSPESSVFLAGKSYPIPAKDFNKVTVDFSVMKDQSQSGGLYLPVPTSGNVGYHLTFTNDGKVSVAKVRTFDSVSYKITNERSATVYNLPQNSLIFAEGSIWVEGKINNVHLTVAAANLAGGSPANIYLFNNLLYTNKDGRDVMGLLAQNNIQVGLYSQDNLEIDGALVAQTGKVIRDYYTASNSTAYYIRNSITIYGAIATNRRYGFAWICGNSHCSGYRNRDIIYDNNLLYFPPPFFPTGDNYMIDLWEEEQ